MARRSYRELVDEAKKKIDNLSAQQVKQEMSNPDTVVIDVREQEELLQTGKIPGSRHIPRGRLEMGVESMDLKEDQRIILHCAGGGRSALAAASLQQLGFTNLAHLETGFRGWQESGAEIEKFEPKK